MPTSSELEEKITRLEAALRARAAETAAREAELQDLKDTLHKHQSTRADIRAAVEAAMSDNPITDKEPTDVLEIFTEDFGLSAEEAVQLALVTMRDHLGAKGLVKWIVQSAVETSGLDAQGVIKAALETVRGSDLSVQEVVLASLQAARNTRNIYASEIIRPAVDVAMELGIEVDVIFKEIFVAALRHSPSMLRSCLLSVLGCSVGMGMTYREVKGLLKDFSKAVKHGAFGQRSADEPEKKVRFFIPHESQDPNGSPSAQSQTSPSPRNCQAYQYIAELSVIQDSLFKNDPAQSVVGTPVPMIAPWHPEHVDDHEAPQNVDGESSSAAAAQESAKRSVDDDGDQDAETSRPSKKRRRRETDSDDEQ